MSDDEELLHRINGVQVSTDDLLDLAAACDEYRQQHPDREDEGMAGMFLAAQQASRNPAKAFALWSRMSALAKLLIEQGAHGWTLANGKRWVGKRPPSSLGARHNRHGRSGSRDGGSIH